MQKTRVISGFPGVGKSTLFRSLRHLEHVTVLDSDSSKFSWENEAERIRHPQWPANYIDHIRENLRKADIILVSSHEVVRDALVKAGIEFELVYPGPEMKAEYIKRYVDRGNNPKFVEMLETNYDTWIAELMNQTGCTHLVLGPGQYLSHVL